MKELTGRMRILSCSKISRIQCLIYYLALYILITQQLFNKNTTKPTNQYSENTQGLYILSKAASNATQIDKTNSKPINSKCNTCNYTKDLLPIDYSRYMLFLNRPSVKKCTHIDPSGNKCSAGTCATCDNHLKSTSGV